VKLLPRKSSAAIEQPVEDVVETAPEPGAPKGRPTPKRRDSAPRRTPIVQPPRNRKEAYRWQKQQAQKTRTSGQALSKQDYRAALARGD
jgi:Protein of unknown function (DUF3043)